MREQFDTLPIPPTPLVGRGRELADVHARLLNPEVRLLTLTGPGGTGKTRLAVAAAVDVRDAFPDGVWFVNLAVLTDDALVLPTIAQALDVKELPGTPLLDSLAGSLRKLRALLVLDNFEHVVAAAPDVVRLLESCGGLKLLVTSRTALRVYGEHQYVVPPLSVPDPAHLPAFDALIQCEAVALFIQRAQAAHAAFHATPEDAAAIAEVCARVDGLPLAIELAAARIRLLPPQALAARLNRRLSMLTSKVQNVPPRQQTLRRTIDWSYDLLDAAEQSLFRRMAVFAGGCTLAAAEAVCAEPALPTPGDGDGIVEGLASLVDKSLLEQRTGADGEPRFAFIETIHEYALELLEASADYHGLRDTHARLFLRLAEQAEPEFIGPRQVEWFARVDAERENLRSALDWTLASGPSEAGVRLAAALFRYWDSRGQLTEGQRWLERALAPGGQVGDIWRAKALNVAGNTARRRGDLELATARLEQCLALRRALADTPGIAAVLANLGNIAFDNGDYDRAARLYQESLSLYRGVGDRAGMALALNTVAIALREQGHPEQAVALHDESLALRRELGDPRGIAQAIENLGRAALEQGDLDRATALLREALALGRELGDRGQSPMTLEDLGRAMALGGQLVQAVRLWGAADILRSRFGTPMPAHRRRRYSAAVADARARLGEREFEVAWAAGRVMDAEAAAEYALADERPPHTRAAPHPLSPREQEVAVLIARGLTSKQIAAELVVSEKTVDTHADHIRQKLGLGSRAEIAAWAVGLGLASRP